MANSYKRSQFEESNAARRTRLLLSVSFAAAGAPTIVAGTGMGIASIIRNSAGDYSIALTQAYAALLGVSCLINSGASAPAAPSLNLRTNSVAVAAAPLIRVTFRDLAGAPADPASGEIALLEIKLNNSSLSY